MEAISRILYRILNRFSLPFMMKLLVDSTGSWRSKVFFGLIVVFTLNCFRQNLLAFSYMSSGQFETYRLVNPHAHAFYEATLGHNSAIFVAAISYLSYCVPIVHYSLFRAGKHFREEMTEIVVYIEALYAHRFTFLDRVFYRKFTAEQVQFIHWSLISANRTDGYSGRFLTRRDRIRVIFLFEILEKLWLISLAAISGLMAFTYLSIVHLMYVQTGNRLTIEFVIVVLTITSYMFFILVAFPLPVLLFAFLTILLFTNQCAWGRFCVDFRRLHSRFYRKSPSNNFLLRTIEVYRKLISGQKVWIGAFTELSKINRLIVCEIFAVSIGTTLTGNIILVVELVIVPLEWRVRVVLTIILAVQFFLIGSLTMVLLRLRTRLYSLSPLIRHHVVKQSLSGYFRLRSLWKGHINMEILCPHRKWTFKLGALGQITSRNILLKCPALYTALILFILPVVERENILK